MKDERFKELVKDGFYVKVNNEKETMVVLKMCEKHGIKWITKKRATSYKPNECEHPYFLHICEWSKGTVITYLDIKNRRNLDPDHKIIDIKEFLSPKQEIHITRKDNETHAILKENGKVVKHTVAKCHPDDEYSFEIGSDIAIGRLFNDKSINAYMIYDYFKQVEKEINKTILKTVDEEKNKPQFKVGDIVRIRQWDDMVKEFGVDTIGGFNGEYIKCNKDFLAIMSKFCGKIAIITSIEVDNEIKVDFIDGYKDSDYDWRFSTDMIEPYQPKQAEIGEYAMIIKDFENTEFKRGTVVKRTGATECEYIIGDKFTEFKNSDGISIILSPKEYVILEDYKLPLNCRFVVGNDVESLTAGKIYEIKDGVFKDDDGIEFPCLDLGDEQLHTLDDLEEFIGKAGAGHYTDEVVEYIVLKN